MNAAIYSLFISLALRMSVITVFVMLIKLIFRDKLSAAAHCSIWLILFVQSMFCVGNVSIPAKASIYNVMQEVAVRNAEPIVDAVSVSAQHDIRNLIALVYIMGVFAMLLWYIGVFVVHSIRVSQFKPVNDHITLAILEDIKSRLDIHDNILIRRGSYAHTLSRTVVLPDGYTEEELRQIILHELCHYKHKDNMKLWAAVVVISLNWFNPLVWFAFRRFRADIEMYCDDSVLKLTDSRKEYAAVLVKTACDHIRFVPGTSSAANGKHEVSRRVRRIALWKKKKPVWLVIAVMASVCISCLCLTDAVTVAVENTVSEVSATPEPVSSVSEMIENTIPMQSTPEPTPTNLPERRNVSTQRPAAAEPAQNKTATVQEPIRSTQAPAQNTAAVITAPPEAVAEDYGTKESVSANGSREIYSRDDGSTVVLQYGDDGGLQTGYIIDDEE